MVNDSAPKRWVRSCVTESSVLRAVDLPGAAGRPGRRREEGLRLVDPHGGLPAAAAQQRRSGQRDAGLEVEPGRHTQQAGEVPAAGLAIGAGVRVTARVRGDEHADGEHEHRARERRRVADQRPRSPRRPLGGRPPSVLDVDDGEVGQAAGDDDRPVERGVRALRQPSHRLGLVAPHERRRAEGEAGDRVAVARADVGVDVRRLVGHLLRAEGGDDHPRHGQGDLGHQAVHVVRVALGERGGGSPQPLRRARLAAVEAAPRGEDHQLRAPVAIGLGEQLTQRSVIGRWRPAVATVANQRMTKDSARSRSPARAAWVTAPSASPWASNQSLARRWRYGVALRVRSGQFALQVLGQQVVEAVPRPVVVERDDQQGPPLHVVEQLRRPVAFQHVVAQRAGQAFQARRVQQEGGRRRVESGDQLLGQELDDEAMVATEVRSLRPPTPTPIRCRGSARRGRARPAIPRFVRAAWSRRVARSRCRGRRTMPSPRRRRRPDRPGRPRPDVAAPAAVRGGAGSPSAPRRRWSSRRASRRRGRAGCRGRRGRRARGRRPGRARTAADGPRASNRTAGASASRGTAA